MPFDIDEQFAEMQRLHLVHQGSEKHWRDFLTAVANEMACEDNINDDERPAYRHRNVPSSAGPGERFDPDPRNCESLIRIAQSQAWALWSDYEDACFYQHLELRATAFIGREYGGSSSEVKQHMRQRYGLISFDPFDEVAAMMAEDS